VRVNPRQRTIKTLFKTYLDVVHIKKTDSRRLGVDSSTREDESRIGVGRVGVGVGGEEADEMDEGDDAMDIQAQLTGGGGGQESRNRTAADLEEKLAELSRREDIYEFLSRSLAPSIWEMDDVKKGILLQLFGGTNKVIGRGGGGGGPRYRGDINVLLVGDPGTSKSQLLQVRKRSEWSFL
jgi:DNA replication licensing factor MCM4